MGNSNNYSNRGNNNSRSNNNRAKHTGAKFKRADRNGAPCTTGWNYSKRFGLVTFLCVVTGASKSGRSASGKPWVTVMVKVTKPMCAPYTVSGIMNSDNGNVSVPDLGIVILPTAKNGGFCGRLNKK